MNIEYYYYFIDTTRLSSISKAASLHNISQQGLSRAIRCLESHYDITLFERSGNVIKLTTAGEAFLAEAQHVVNAHERLVKCSQRFANHRKDWDWSLDALITLNVAFNIWPLLSKRLRREFPDCLLSVKELTHEQIVTKLCVDTKDPTFALMSIPETFSIAFQTLPLSFEPIMDVWLMAKVGRTSAYANQKTVTIKNLREAELVLHDDPALEQMLMFLTGAHETHLPRTILRTSNNELMGEALKRRRAIGFSNTFCLHYNQTEDAAILPLEQSVRTPVYFVCHKMFDDQFPQIVHVRSYLKRLVEEAFPLVAYKGCAEDPCSSAQSSAI